MLKMLLENRYKAQCKQLPPALERALLLAPARSSFSNPLKEPTFDRYHQWRALIVIGKVYLLQVFLVVVTREIQQLVHYPLIFPHHCDHQGRPSIVIFAKRR
jgi:hypothetical protein